MTTVVLNNIITVDFISLKLKEVLTKRWNKLHFII